LLTSEVSDGTLIPDLELARGEREEGRNEGDEIRDSATERCFLSQLRPESTAVNVLRAKSPLSDGAPSTSAKEEALRKSDE